MEEYLFTLISLACGALVAIILYSLRGVLAKRRHKRLLRNAKRKNTAVTASCTGTTLKKDKNNAEVCWADYQYEAAGKTYHKKIRYDCAQQCAPNITLFYSPSNPAQSTLEGYVETAGYLANAIVLGFLACIFVFTALEFISGSMFGLTLDPREEQKMLRYLSDPRFWVMSVLIIAGFVINGMFLGKRLDKMEKIKNTAIAQGHVLSAVLIKEYHTDRGNNEENKMTEWHWVGIYEYEIDGIKKKKHLTFDYAPPRSLNFYYVNSPDRLFYEGQWDWAGQYLALLRFVLTLFVLYGITRLLKF